MIGRSLVVAAAVGTTLIATTAGAGAAAQKEPLVGPEAVITCDNLLPIEFTSLTSGPGFVIFNEDGSGRIHANVKFKGAEPETTYVVRLIQGTPSGGDCHVEDAVFTTDSKGNGGVNIKEAVQPDATAAQVIIDTGSIFETPTFRGSELFRLS